MATLTAEAVKEAALAETTVTLKPETAARLRDIAERNGKSMSEAAEYYVKSMLDWEE